MTTHGAALQDAVAHATEVLTAPVAGLVPGRLSTSQYVTMLRDVERLGRLVDAARVALAGEAERRTCGPVDALAALGYASAVDAVATLTGLSDRDAKRRIRLGGKLNAGLSLTGAETGSVHPSVARAVSAGNLGVDAATILTDALEGVSPRIDPVVITEAEEALVHLAEGSPDHPPLRADFVRGQAHLFVEAIDPDGVRPREELARRKRRFTIGPETHDGLIPVHGLLTLEIGARLKRLIDAHVRKVTFTDGPRQLDDMTRPVEAVESVESVESVDDRTPAQRRHDTLADIVSAASRVKDAPELAGAAPAIIVTVTLTVLDSGRGVGSIDGVDTPISVDAIEKMTDSRGIQTVTMNPDRRILSLGSVQRCFTSSQRRAITARDGGCVIPGCTTPAGWCEVHHVIPWRAGGETHTDNGVLLCWGHHQNIDRGPWRLTMSNGIPRPRARPPRLDAHHEDPYRATPHPHRMTSGAGACGRLDTRSSSALYGVRRGGNTIEETPGRCSSLCGCVLRNDGMRE